MSNSLFCDNYATCHEMVLGLYTKELTVTRARAGGWHVYVGITTDGRPHTGILGPKCVGTSRPTPALKILPGQLELDLEEGHDQAA